MPRPHTRIFVARYGSRMTSVRVLALVPPGLRKSRFIIMRGEYLRLVIDKKRQSKAFYKEFHVESNTGFGISIDHAHRSVLTIRKKFACQRQVSISAYKLLRKILVRKMLLFCVFARPVNCS
jgi:hypothetical protein